MKLVFATNPWDDYSYRQKNDKRALRRINELSRDIQSAPFAGIGMREPLKHQLRGL